jgi:hypothetical protein
MTAYLHLPQIVAGNLNAMHRSPQEEAKGIPMHFPYLNISSTLKGLENRQLLFLELNGSTGFPKEPLEYYECEGDVPFSSANALQWLNNGSSVGLLLDGRTYALKFQGTNLESVQEAISLGFIRENQEQEGVPIFGNMKGDYIALFEAPEQLRSMNSTSILRNLQVPGTSETVDFYWGSQAAIRLIDPLKRLGGFQPVGDWVPVPELHPRAWTDMKNLVTNRPKMIGVYAAREERRQLAINHLRLIRASLKPTDDFQKVLTDTAADLVIGLRLDPYESFELFNRPLGRRGGGESLIEALLHRMSDSRKPNQTSLLRLCEDAVDGVSPLAMALWKKETAENAFLPFVDVLRCLPPASDEDFILADQFRIEACELLGIDSSGINQKVFGDAITTAIEKHGVQVKRDRLLHPVLGNVVIYRGLTIATLHTTWYWWNARVLPGRVG